MAPIVADGASVAYAKDEEDVQQLDGKLVVTWLDNQPVVRWFQHCGRFALLRAENPNTVPQQVLVDLEDQQAATPVPPRPLGQHAPLITAGSPTSSSEPSRTSAASAYQLRYSPKQGSTRILPSPIRPVRAWPTIALIAAGACFLAHEERQLDLGQERRVVFAAQVLVQPVLLPPVAHRLANRSRPGRRPIPARPARPGPERLDQGDDLDDAVAANQRFRIARLRTAALAIVVLHRERLPTQERSENRADFCCRTRPYRARYGRSRRARLDISLDPTESESVSGSREPTPSRCTR